MGQKPKRKAGPELNPRQAKFVEEYLKDGNVKRAATAAGYSGSTACGSKIKMAPAVKDALDKVRDKAIVTAAYNADAAMTEADDAIAFAKETGNANAYVKAVELKSKLKGLLIEKHQHQVATFSLNINGVRDKKTDPEDVVSEIVTSTSKTEQDEEEEDVFS